MCALVALSGSHGMLSLHVCVDYITLPSGRLMEIGPDIRRTSITGVPGSTKFPVASASATAISTAIFILPVLKQVPALGKSLKLSAKIVFFHESAHEQILVFARTRTSVC